MKNKLIRANNFTDTQLRLAWYIAQLFTDLVIEIALPRHVQRIYMPDVTML